MDPSPPAARAPARLRLLRRALPLPRSSGGPPNPLTCPASALPNGPQDFEGGSLYGLEKLWAFHHYTGFPRDQPNLEMLPKVGYWGMLGAAAYRVLAAV